MANTKRNKRNVSRRKPAPVPILKQPTQQQIDLAKWVLSCNLSGKLVNLGSDVRAEARAILIDAFARVVEPASAGPLLASDLRRYASGTGNSWGMVSGSTRGSSDYSGSIVTCSAAETK